MLLTILKSSLNCHLEHGFCWVFALVFAEVLINVVTRSALSNSCFSVKTYKQNLILNFLSSSRIRGIFHQRIIIAEVMKGIILIKYASHD